MGREDDPEGATSVPHAAQATGVVILGDSAGFVDVPSSGIHYAMQSGMFAARSIPEAGRDDTRRGSRNTTGW